MPANSGKPLSASRDRTLARQLQGRILVVPPQSTDDSQAARLFLVGGQPDLGILRDALSKMVRDRDSLEILTPVELGFPTSEIVPVTRSGLNSRHRALERWKGDLDASRRSSEVESMRAEVAEIEAQVQALFEQLRRLDAGGVSQTEFILRQRDRDALQQLEQRIPTDRADDLALRRLLRVTAWASGVTVASCFLQSVIPFLMRRDDRFEVDQLQAALCSLQSPPPVSKTTRLDPRRRNEIWWNAHGIDAEQQEARWERSNRVVPLIESAGVDWSAARRMIHGSDADVEQEVSRRLRALPPWMSPQDLAALSAWFTSRAIENPISPRLFLKWSTRIEQAPSVLDGPLRVRSFLDTLDPAVTGRKTSQIRLILRWFEIGNPPALSAIWVQRLAGSLVEEEDPRRLVDVLEACGDKTWRLESLLDCSLRLKDVHQLLRRFRRVGSTAEMVLLLEHLSGVNEQVRRRLTRRISQWLHSLEWCRLDGRQLRTFLDILQILTPTGNAAAQLSSIMNSWFLRTWSNTAAERRLMPQNVPAATQRLLRQFLSDRRRLGRSTQLPRSVREHLQQQEQDSREAAYLQGRIDSGQASPGQTQRWQSLQNRDHVAPDRRLLRLAARAATRASVELLQGMLHKWVRRVWRDLFGERNVLLNDIDQVAIVRWATLLDPRSSERLATISEAWKQWGPEYRRRLPRNAHWMQRATERGVDLTVWLSAQQTQIFSGDSRYSLTISTNPFEPFLMGHWFQTCLSITHTGGFNSWSVFANAADANKLLLVVRDDHGNVVGRKLLAISKAWELIPFRTYLRLDNEDLRRDLERAIDEECLRVAARMGLCIGQRADIDPLHGWDWYDDGPVAAEGPDRPATLPAAVSGVDDSPPELDAGAIAELELSRAIDTLDSTTLERYANSGTDSPRRSASRFWWLTQGGSSPAPFPADFPFDGTLGWWMLRSGRRWPGPARRSRDIDILRVLVNSSVAARFSLPFETEPVRRYLETLRAVQSVSNDPGEMCRHCLGPTLALTAAGTAVTVQILQQFERLLPNAYPPACCSHQATIMHWAGTLIIAWEKDGDSEALAALQQGARDLSQSILLEVATRIPLPECMGWLRRELRRRPTESSLNRDQLTRAFSLQSEGLERLQQGKPLDDLFEECSRHADGSRPSHFRGLTLPDQMRDALRGERQRADLDIVERLLKYVTHHVDLPETDAYARLTLRLTGIAPLLPRELRLAFAACGLDLFQKADFDRVFPPLAIWMKTFPADEQIGILDEYGQRFSVDSGPFLWPPDSSHGAYTALFHRLDALDQREAEVAESLIVLAGTGKPEVLVEQLHQHHHGLKTQVLERIWRRIAPRLLADLHRRHEAPGELIDPALPWLGYRFGHEELLDLLKSRDTNDLERVSWRVQRVLVEQVLRNASGPLLDAILRGIRQAPHDFPRARGLLALLSPLDLTEQRRLSSPATEPVTAN